MDLPLGIQFSGVKCGLKPSGKLDLAVFVMEQPGVAAGVYTQNVVRAASIDWNRNITPTHQFRGLVVNSGNANACTGELGERDNRRMAQTLASCIGATPDQCCVLSTGVIGEHLDMDKVTSGIESAVQVQNHSQEAFENAAEAIITTDRNRKIVVDCLQCESGEVRIAAVAKGAGMIGPNMATMLSVVATDALLSPSQAQSLIKNVVDRSFNRISVEGHTSTNDAVLLLASGKSPVGEMTHGDLEELEKKMTLACVKLAQMIPSDGEGASKLISITVTGAEDDAAADRVARSVAQSSLVKTAVYGCDPNWGRVVSAAGYCGVPFAPHECSLKIGGFELYRNGSPTQFDAAEVSEAMRSSENVEIDLSIGTGGGNATHWTSDLTVDYVRFNSEYHT